MRDKENYQLGFILWYDNDKGFGKIKSVENIVAFLHINAIKDEIGQIRKGNSFLFSYERGKRGWAVKNARAPHSNEDFFFGINQLIKTPHSINVEVTVSGKSRWGNPYRRKETREVNTFNAFLRKLAEKRTVFEMAELFRQAFNQNYSTHWKGQDVKQFYEITKKVFPRLTFVPSVDESDFSIRQKEDVANDLVIYYDSNLSIQDKFDNLKGLLSKTAYMSGIKKTIDFDVEYISANKEKLAIQQTSNLIKQFNLPEYIIKDLANPYFIKKISDLESISPCLKILDSLELDLRVEYFGILINSFTDEFYFKIWKEKKLFVDFVNKSFSVYWHFDNDFVLPKRIIQRQISNIGIDELVRIQNIHKDDKELVIYLIKELLEKEYSTNDFRRLLIILESLDFEIPSFILDLILDKTLNTYPESLISLQHSDRIRLFKILPHKVISNSIIDNLDLNIDSLTSTFKTIPYSTDFGNKIIKRLEYEKAPVRVITKSLTYLKTNGHAFPLELLIENLKDNIIALDIIHIFQFALSLEKKEQDLIESALAESLADIKVTLNERHFELIKLDSPEILKSFILYSITQLKQGDNENEMYLSNGKIILDALFGNPSTTSLGDNVFEEYVGLFYKENEIKVLEYLIQHRVGLYNDFLCKLPFSTTSIVGIIPQFERSIELLKPHVKEDNPFFYIYNIIANKNSLTVTEHLNSFFRKYDYQFQSLFLKYFINQYKENITSNTMFHSILNGIDLKELAALMIKEFIVNKFEGREGLMELMNVTLKSHFMVLNEINDEKNNFANLFSIESLVNHCDGRKHFGGLTRWQGGREIRYYTNGNNPIIVGETENIYCEGRFWKNVRFYDSESNRPLNNTNEFYWCRNKVCVGVNNKVNMDNAYYEWNLNEINEIFQLNLDRLAFIHLAGWLNRMETIFQRLSCYECEQYLRPKAYTPKQLGHYGVPLFWCINDNCSCHNKEIRFTHCRGCHKILDSRECEKCIKCGWLKCDDDNCNKCGCNSNYLPVYVEYE